MRSKLYTVVLLKPNSIQDGTPLDAHTVAVRARSPGNAVVIAQNRTAADHSDNDCRPIAVFEGYCENIIIKTSYAR